MATSAVAGVVAAGRWPTWIVPAAVVTTDPTTPGGSIPLAQLLDPSVVKIDCHFDPGDVTVSRTPTTKSRQRACQVVAETIATGETIDVTISAVYDQQAADAAAVNEAYTAVPKDAEVYVVTAFGWESATAPDTTTVVDIIKGTVQTRTKNYPTTADEDLKFTATISASAYFEDITLTGP